MKTPITDPGWQAILQDEFNKAYMHQLSQFLNQEKLSHTIYPKGGQIFRAFNLTPFDQVKVVVLGQDPYHGANQANGLAFSVNPGLPFPPSLVNIFIELKEDLGIERPNHGDLSYWAKQGILLLNTVLTVQAQNAGSHKNKGWEQFTNLCISQLSEKKQNLIFILWGKAAQEKLSLIDQKKHFVLQSAHPSPFSAYSGFFHSHPFSQTNQLLKKIHMSPIDWTIPNITL